MDFLITQNIEYALQLVSIILFIIFFIFIIYYINSYLTEKKIRQLYDKEKERLGKDTDSETKPDDLDNSGEKKDLEQIPPDELTKKLIKVGLKKEQIEKLKPHLGKNN